MAEQDPEQPAASADDAAPDETALAAAPDDASPGTALDDAALDVEARARDAERAAPANGAANGRARGRARQAAIIGLRVVTGVVGTAVALVVVVAVGLLPIPTLASATAPTTTVTPTPAAQLRLCAGALLRLGDTQGENAGTPSTLGAPQQRSTAQDAILSTQELARSDADTGGTASAPVALQIDGGSGLLAGAQSQTAKSDDITGFAASACAEPSSSAWLVGGSTATGRTTLLTLANPTPVDASITLQIWGEKGAVQAPGLAGIVVAAGAQRVLSLAGFAPDLASPVVHVTARGGRVVAALQQSTVRGLDPGGVDLVGATADPARSLSIPGVRVRGADAVAQSLGLDDWSDATPSIRVANPGAVAAKVQVALQPESAGAKGASFELDVPAGQVKEVGLDSGIDTDTGALAIPDGEYSVTVQSDQPVVAAARISTADQPAADGSAPASDFAWDVAAPALDGPTLVTIAPGPDPRVAVQGAAAGRVTLKGLGAAADVTITVPAGGEGSASVVAGASYEIEGADGMSASVGYAGDAALSGYAITSPRPVSGPLTIHP